MRIPIPDRTGAAAEVFTLAAELGVNIASFEVVHLAESNVGVAVVLVDADVAELYRGGLIARGFRPAVTAPELSARRACSRLRRARRARSTPSVDVPGSKSIANRALVVRRARRRRQRADAACPTATTRWPWSTACRRSASAWRVDGDRRPSVAGSGGRARRRRPVALDAGLAGTTSRFVTAARRPGAGPGHDRRRAAAAPPPDGPAARRPRRARRRPSSAGERRGHLPVTVTGPLPHGGAVALPGDVSQPVPDGADADRPAARRRAAHAR